MTVLFVTQFIHLLVDLFVMTYAFIFNSIYDIYFICFLLSQIFHWELLKNECIISYIEKKIINPNYELGSYPFWSPHRQLFFNNYTNSLRILFIIGGLIYIIYRNKKYYIKIITILAISLWLYFNFSVPKIKYLNLY